MVSPIDLGISWGIVSPTYDVDGTILPQYRTCETCPHLEYTEFEKLDEPREAYNIELLESGRYQVEPLVNIYITHDPIAGYCHYHGIDVLDFKNCPECKFLE